MTPFRPARVAIACTVLMTASLLSACSADDSTPPKETVDVPPGTVVFRRFTNAEQTQAALFTMSTDGKDEHQITKPPEDAIDSFPDWSPDEKQVVFHREFTDRPYEVHIVNADGSDEHRVDQGGSPIASGDQLSDASEPAWSPDGKTLAFTWAYGKFAQLRGGEWIEVAGIGTMRVDGSKATQVTQRKRPTTTEDKTVTWSPDGRRIAFTRQNKTDKPLDAKAIFVANADGTEARRVTPWEIAGQEPAWSPDGQLISFRSEPNDAEDFIGEIYTVKPDGSDLTQVTKANGKQVLSMSFSPDSRWIVFAMEGVDHLPDLFVMRRDGSDVTPITRTSTWESAPDWAPAD